jgi:hypothetical protein
MARYCFSLAKKFSTRCLPRLVEVLVVRAGVLAVGLGRDHRGLAGPGERVEHPLLGVERLVGDQRAGFEPGE